MRQLIAGVINRQTRCILKDPYANAFYKDDNKVSEWKSDRTEMKPGVHERKWEIDSLCLPHPPGLPLLENQQRHAPFDAVLARKRSADLQTFREQQRKNGRGPVPFPAAHRDPTDSLPGSGYGRPVKPVGLICSMFRPSDDSTVFPFLVPSNFFAVVSLRQAAEMLEAGITTRHPPPNAAPWRTKSKAALRQYAIVDPKSFGKIYAYEIDGYGNSYCIDDGNVPACSPCPISVRWPLTDPLYQNTRRRCLPTQSLLLQGPRSGRPRRAARGAGHDLAARRDLPALTSTREEEISFCLDTCKNPCRHRLHA